MCLHVCPSFCFLFPSNPIRKWRTETFSSDRIGSVCCNSHMNCCNCADRMHKVMRGHTDPRVEAVSVVVWDTLLFIFTYGVVRLRHKNHLDWVRKTICCRLRCFTNIQWFHAYKWWNAAGKCPHLEKLKCCLSLSIHLISISSKRSDFVATNKATQQFHTWSLTFVDTLSLIYQCPPKKICHCLYKHN